MRSNLHRTPMLYLIMGVIGLCTMSACNFSSGDETITVQPIDIIVPLDASNIASIVGITFEFSSGAAIHSDLAGKVTTVTFTSATTFEIASGGDTATGTVDIDACTFTIDESTFAEGDGPQAGDVITISDCELRLRTSDSAETGTSQSGSVTLILDGSESDPETVTIRFENAGGGFINIFINDELVATARVRGDGTLTNPRSPRGGTGATGTGGTGG